MERILAEKGVRKETNDMRVAVKAFIVRNGEALLLRRRMNDPHKPGAWDIPGGRLELGEDPTDGLKREAREEAGLDIDSVLPLDVHHFRRDDGQEIYMIIFWCTAKDGEVVLFHEHVEFKWCNVRNKADFPEWLIPVVDKFVKYNLDRVYIM
jgi:8-oxo-dGTP diphosphatase